MKTEWRPIAGFPEYEVSNLGDVANIKRGVVRKVSYNQAGILKITLYTGREIATRSVALLVAEAFVEGRTPFFNTPINLDGDRKNCRADNLAWRPRWFAVAYHRQFFDPTFHRSDVNVIDVDSGIEYRSLKEAAIANGIHYNDIYKSYLYGHPVRMTNQVFQLVDDELQSL